MTDVSIPFPTLHEAPEAGTEGTAQALSTRLTLHSAVAFGTVGVAPCHVHAASFTAAVHQGESAQAQSVGALGTRVALRLASHVLAPADTVR
eukprot:Skav200672  [mRNA]  locus=scaffold1967:132482:132757:+ [translate_table: standard]